MREWLLEELGNGNAPASCPVCNHAKIYTGEAQTVLLEEEFQRWLKIERRSVQIQQGYIPCPEPDCEGMVHPDDLKRLGWPPNRFQCNRDGCRLFEPARGGRLGGFCLECKIDWDQHVDDDG
eukprot:gene2926-6999_t